MTNIYRLILELGYIGGYLTLIIFLFGEMNWKKYKHPTLYGILWAILFVFIMPFVPFIYLFIEVKSLIKESKRRKTKAKEEREADEE